MSKFSTNSEEVLLRKIQDYIKENQQETKDHAMGDGLKQFLSGEFNEKRIKTYVTDLINEKDVLIDVTTVFNKRLFIIAKWKRRKLLWYVDNVLIDYA